MIKHAAIIPLIGGLPLGCEQAFGVRPEVLFSYSAFQNNDQHLVKYYENAPYIHLDAMSSPAPTNLKGKLDVVSSTCPCSGLSSLSPSAKSDSSTNDWMVQSSKFVLESLRPKVLFGENAPRLASKMGEPTVLKLRQLAKDNGYTFALYKTKSILHGLSQVRDRSFFFFFRGDHVPVLPFYNREHITIEDHIRSVKLKSSDPMNVLTNKKTPSKDDPYYQYVLEQMLGGVTHQDFQKKITRSINPMDYLEQNGGSYSDVAKWFQKIGLPEKKIKRALEIGDKLQAGGNIMRKITEIPKDYIGAFVGHLPTSLTHPDEDRYLTARECLTLMGMPKDFNIQGGLRNLNHVCQNVPVTTAADMASGVKLFLEGKLPTEKTDFLVIDNKARTVTGSTKPGNSLDEFFN